MTYSKNKATPLAAFYNFAKTKEQHEQNIVVYAAMAKTLFAIWDANGENAHDLFTKINK